MNAPKLWPAEPWKCSLIVSSGRPFAPKSPRDFAADDRADHAVHVADRLGRFQLSLRVPAPAHTVAAASYCRAPGRGRGPGPFGNIGPRIRHLRLKEDVRKVQALRLVVVDGLGHFEALAVSDLSSTVRKPSWAMSSRTSNRDEAHEIDDVLRVAGKLLPPSRGSCVATPTGAGVQVAHAHHDAAEETSGAVANPNSSAPSSAPITTSRPVFNWPSTFDHDAAAQVVDQQCLPAFGEAQFPRSARVLDTRLRRRARAAVVAANQHHVGVRLRYACRDRADADFGHQFHADASVMVAVLQIVDQLRKVFDAVNVRGAAAAKSGPTPGVAWRTFAIHG